MILSQQLKKPARIICQHKNGALKKVLITWNVGLAQVRRTKKLLAKNDVQHPIFVSKVLRKIEMLPDYSATQRNYFHFKVHVLEKLKRRDYSDNCLLRVIVQVPIHHVTQKITCV